MHEMSLMGGVFEAIENALFSHDVKRVLKVKLKVGELTNAVEDSLQLAFEAFGKDTVCEGAELVIERVPLKARCLGCESEFKVKAMLFLCPECGGSAIDLVQGQELLLESLEVESFD